MGAPEITCVLDAKAEVGAGAVWDVRDQALWWGDIPRGVVPRLDPAAAVNRSWEIGEPVGCLALREQGGLLLALKSGYWFVDPESGTREAVSDPEADRPQNRFNDGVADPRGRFWA